MIISLVGAGNLATQLGLALKEKGHVFSQVYSRTAVSAEPLASGLGAEPVIAPEKITSDADLYICALKDDALTEVLPEINFGNHLVVHTAGSLSMDILAPYTSDYGVLYPLQTFSKTRKADFSEIPVFIEAVLPESRNKLFKLASELSGNVRILDSVRRMNYHLSAVFACNFVNYMYSIAGDIVEEKGLGFKDLLPLIDETARKVHEMPPKLAQTGPATRFDRKVMDKHVTLLYEHPEWAELYEKLSRCIYYSLKK
jgi:predicted short-subunit dehydrogenase-like oxidoreductase (DUF2520 family)